METELYRFEIPIGRDADFKKNGIKQGKELSNFYPKQTRFYFSGPKSLFKIS